MANRNTASECKAQYLKPKLAIYGEFANLTAGGTGSTLETRAGSNNALRQVRT